MTCELRIPYPLKPWGWNDGVYNDVTPAPFSLILEVPSLRRENFLNRKRWINRTF